MNESSATPKDDPPIYRIGAQVHDHEARIRLLENNSTSLATVPLQIRALAEKFDSHVMREDSDRVKLMATSVITVVAVLLAAVLIIYSKTI